jgi:predicted phage terminase large subunit-like protein
MDCPATVKAVRELTGKWPARFAKLIEDKANGSAVIQMLAHEIPGLLPVNPSGGKIARAQGISPLVEAGNVYLPHPAYAPWVNDFIEECVQFPNGAHDDQVEALISERIGQCHAQALHAAHARHLPYTFFSTLRFGRARRTRPGGTLGFSWTLAFLLRDANTAHRLGCCVPRLRPGQLPDQVAR